VLNDAGEILAAINCSTATTRITQQEMVRTRLEVLNRAAKQIEQELRRYPILAHSIGR
jgi:IclR family pca regulon transcriptional regulator